MNRFQTLSNFVSEFNLRPYTEGCVLGALLPLPDAQRAQCFPSGEPLQTGQGSYGSYWISDGRAQTFWMVCVSLSEQVILVLWTMIYPIHAQYGDNKMNIC